MPLVASPQVYEALHVIERHAAEQNVPLTLVGRDVHYKLVEHSLAGQDFLLWTPADQAHMDEYLNGGRLEGWQPLRLHIPLLGYHQVVNAATAYAALQQAAQAGLKLSDEAIRQGFAQAAWPARFEVLQAGSGATLVLDCAHNRDSALKLRLALDDYFPGQPVVMVFGASEDKDVAGMFAELLPRVKQLIAVKSFHPRAMEPQILLDLAHQAGCPACLVPDVADALDEALRLAGSDALVLVTGSIFVAAGARIHWFAHRSSHA